MPQDERTFITVHDGMPDHPKIEALSDKAFRALVTLWCWCSRNKTDGLIKVTVWHKKVTKKARDELDAELIHAPGHDCPQCPGVPDGHVLMHDYLQHQRSAEEIELMTDVKRASGALGNHVRWHVGKRRDPNCEHCGGGPPDPKPSHKGSQVRSHPASQMGSQNDRTAIAETESEIKNPVVTSRREVTNPRAGNNHARAKTAELAATAHSPTAHRLVEDYATTCRRRPPSSVLSALAVQVDALLAENWHPVELASAITAWGAKGLHPKAFPSVAHELANSTPAVSRPNGTDANIAALLGGAAPELRALPGGKP